VSETAACYRVPVRIGYYNPAHVTTWMPIIEAENPEHARDKALHVYSLREHGDIAVGFPVLLHEKGHHDDGVWGPP
jgi:hypothetical protein